MTALTTEELLPTQFWGLDPVFRTHVKLYIRDVIPLQEIPDYPGVFQLRSHPVVRVDIQGVVVRVDERSQFFSYTLDDGTGVINCTHWKPDERTQQRQHSGSLPRSLSEKWREVKNQKQCSQKGYNLGDLIHVRGKLKKFRDNVEVMASYCVCVKESNKETERMFQLPVLYSKCYNQSTNLPKAVKLTTGSQQHMQQIYDDYELETAVRNYMVTQHLETFTTDDILQSDIIADHLQQIPDTQQKELMLNKVLQNIEKSGDIFHKYQLQNQPKNQPLQYIVSCKCKELKDEILKAIQTWVSLKGDEDGCSDVYIHDQLRKLVGYRQLDRAVIIQCLDRLECDSDVITTAHRRYIVFNHV